MDNYNKGVALAFSTALISGWAVFFNKFAVGLWQSSSVFTTAKNLVTAVLLTSLILLLKRIPELKKLSRKDWSRLIAVGFVGGSVPFLLFFKGLSLTSAGNAAFIHKTLFVWIALLAVPILKEKISGLQFMALAILGLGVYLFAPPGQLNLGYGELMVFLATLLWAAENIIAKIALRNISSLSVAWARMFFGSLFLMVFLTLTGEFSRLFVFSGVKIFWLLLSGAVLFGYVTTWYAALKRAPAVVVSAVLVTAAPVTGLLNAAFTTGQLKPAAILPMALIAGGAILASKMIQKKPALIKPEKTATESLP